MLVTTSLVVVFIALVYIYVRHRKDKLKVLKKLGIKGPEPNLLLGNLTETRDQQWSKLREWRDTYGLPFGYYEGAAPIIVTKDVELLKHVLIKEFPNFHGRKSVPHASPDDKNVSIVDSDGDKWKRIRFITSPTFSAMKMKQMSPVINDLLDKLLHLFEKRANKGESFDIYADFQKLTLDVIGVCGFGIEVNAIENPNDIFLQKCRAIMDLAAGIIKLPLASILVFSITVIEPKIGHWLRRTFSDMVMPNIRGWFDDAVKTIVDHRKASQDNNKIDLVQLLINAEEADMKVDDNQLTASVEGDDEITLKAERQNSNDTKNNKHTLSILEIQSQMFSFLLAGYETTSTALGFVAYDLAMHPDVQHKLKAEVDEYFPDDGEWELDYTSVQKLPYLDMMFSETLRIHPIAPLVTTRLCMSDCTINGQFYPKGTTIQIDMEAIHMDPAHWGPEDPHTYVPERFTAERKAARHPMAWIPFGGGPRNCVGLRFALMEVKITLIRLVKQFVIKRCDDTKVPLPTTKSGVLSPSEGVFVKLEKRTA